jgi:hypothetical protein
MRFGAISAVLMVTSALSGSALEHWTKKFMSTPENCLSFVVSPVVGGRPIPSEKTPMRVGITKPNRFENQHSAGWFISTRIKLLLQEGDGAIAAPHIFAIPPVGMQKICMYTYFRAGDPDYRNDFHAAKVLYSPIDRGAWHRHGFNPDDSVKISREDAAGKIIPTHCLPPSGEMSGALSYRFVGAFFIPKEGLGVTPDSKGRHHRSLPISDHPENRGR